MSYRLLSIWLLLVSLQGLAQVNYPSLSAKGRLVQVAGFTTITVDYERPAARQRKIFGGLVPWGEVWRTGAGHCTLISFSRAVSINDKDLPAGTYALLTIPREDSWTIILNKDTSLYGSHDYNEKKDVLRFTVKPEVIKRFYESMTIEIDVVPYDADMFIAWANTRVQFRIKTGADAAVDKMIEREMIAKKSTDFGQFNDAAFYYNAGNRHLQSMNIIHEGYKMTGEKECHLSKARALEKEGKFSEAIREVKLEMELIRSFVKKKGNDTGIALSGYQWYVIELMKKSGATAK